MAILTATRRLRDTWNFKLRNSEREFFCYLAAVDPLIAEQAWESLTPQQVRNLTIAFRTAAELGELARYALGYARGRLSNSSAGT